MKGWTTAARGAEAEGSVLATPADLEALVSAWGPALTRAAWGMLGDAAEAEDAVQQALVVAWERRSSLRRAESLRAWLFGILAHTCRKQLRAAARRRRRERLFGAWWRRSREAAAGEGESDPRLKALRRALAALEPAFREVVVLRHLQGLSVEDCAAALGLPPGTVKSRCARALARLRTALAREGGDDA